MKGKRAVNVDWRTYVAARLPVAHSPKQYQRNARKNKQTDKNASKNAPKYGKKRKTINTRNSGEEFVHKLYSKPSASELLCYKTSNALCCL